jgi:hypothetical protein
MFGKNFLLLKKKTLFLGDALVSTELVPASQNVDRKSRSAENHLAQKNA